jgi:hypothetical protein
MRFENYQGTEGNNLISDRCTLVSSQEQLFIRSYALEVWIKKSK